MPYPAHIGQRPLDVREAYFALEQYASDYGEEALLLLMHASIPETLRADLLDLIRVNFLPAQGTDRSLEADVLFAPITSSLGAGYYRIDPQVRWHCMALLRSRYRADIRPRALRVAELLWRYVDTIEKRSGGAIDPHLAEFLAIQRWVALAFISPDGAAHAFADALRQADSKPVAARVQLGGLAAAIEMPLTREQTLLAYARGMDALARGDEENGQRILRSLGDEEIRVGKIVLRPPGDLLAETAPAQSVAPPPRIFISYVNAYSHFARPLEQALLALGAIVEWDMNLKSGDAWQETLTRMLDEADVVVSVAGRATQARKFPMEEIARALRLGKLLIPVFVEAVEGPPELIERQAANTDENGRIAYLDGLADEDLPQVIARTARNIVDAAMSDRSRRDAQLTAEDAPEPGAGSPSNGSLTVRQPDPGTLQYLDTTVRSRTEWLVRYDPALLDSLLAKLPSATDSFDELALALAQLLLPEKRDPPQPGDSVHLTLDRAAAALPWEAILGPHDGKRQLPVAVTRSLDGLRPPRRPGSTSAHALLIGDPVSTQTLPDMPEGLPPLPGVRSELGAISETLRAAGYTVMVSEHENADEIMKRLYAREFRILVVLGHSVHEYALDDERMKRPTKRPMKRAAKGQAAEHRTSGFILSDSIFLTAAEIGKMREPPQLVFLNDRHMDGQTGQAEGMGQHGKASTSMTGELLAMGVDCVLTPAWTVDDTASAYWSQRFFEDISRGATLESASIAARTATSDHYPRQSSWAAFQVWGEPDFRLPPPKPSGKRNSAS
ncbi:MAG: hypothetical protein CVU19_14365 [Betaproteobacteria bacterium HGW-Betaproteobacteria-13]|jgi:hypothetical protein|nr:MAG: hypothetical protein CVU19_14365 [Betaproteobacteria bacterium HGW-Betaproteobacteria-13]